ncbi:hypothetical protein DPMN_082558 [Dreissena polymorpha]|uniref:Fucolectin tachylectin-4 pentraxin-1 domain-containing protein n=1 Tax=Dreissena polymorpha TaxID=45954 RepID=A0A9D3YB66_DREPO|nr:hypothetical protein DPMN_082558 [Dreissena polymorpha]
MNFWRLATLCELCSTSAINDTSGQGSVDEKAIGSLMRYKYFVGLSNVSLSTHKLAKQTTEFLTHSASLAVDGNPNSVDTNCTHTAGEPNDWWMVDLGRVFQVTTVNIINRLDECNCGDRLDGIIYEVGITLDSWEECGRFDGPGIGRLEINITCHRAMYGRYVRIRKLNQNALSLCEVFVYS